MKHILVNGTMLKNANVTSVYRKDDPKHITNIWALNVLSLSANYFKDLQKKSFYYTCSSQVTSLIAEETC